MKKNLASYAQNARSFFDNTVDVDMASLHEAFLSKLAPDASILDAGCGSGRDARAFVQRGYDVTAFDASAPLARLASEHCGLDVAVRTFSEVSEISAYDGVWSCASLLHVPVVDLADALDKLWRSLRPGGCFYLSFKLGDGERVHDGRHFTDANEETLRAWLAPLPEVSSVQTWITEDRRLERSEQWINALAMRHHAPARKLVTAGRRPPSCLICRKPWTMRRKSTSRWPSSMPRECACCCPTCWPRWCARKRRTRQIHRAAFACSRAITSISPTPEALRLLVADSYRSYTGRSPMSVGFSV